MNARRVTLNVGALEERRVPASFGFALAGCRAPDYQFCPGRNQYRESAKSIVSEARQPVLHRDVGNCDLAPFQTWAVQANINFGLVSDGGQPLGALGAFQGDSRFGDVRIAGGSLSSNLVGLGAPFDPTVGTWSGDVVFNNAYNLSIGTGTRDDLFTVAMHEAGHSLGLPDNNDPTSVMNGQYDGAATHLSASDIAAIQGLYGCTRPGRFWLVGQS